MGAKKLSYTVKDVREMAKRFSNWGVGGRTTSSADVVSGAQDWIPTPRYTDDAIVMPLQCATQWDALAHIFFDGKMYNDRSPTLVHSNGADEEQHHAAARPDRDAWRSARHAALQEEGQARTRRSDLSGRPRWRREAGRREGRAWGHRADPHRADDDVPQAGELGRIRGHRGRSRPEPHLRAVDLREGDRRLCHRYVGHRGAAQRNARRDAADPLRVARAHGDSHRRDLRPRSPGCGLRRRRRLRVLLRRAAPAGHRSRWARRSIHKRSNELRDLDERSTGSPPSTGSSPSTSTIAG